MAILSSDGKYVTVEKGDNLWNIAKTYLGDGTKYKQLAAINNISNPDLIYVGQVIYLTNEQGSGSTTGSDSANSNKPIITAFGVQSNAENTLFATWSWDKDKTAKYKISWTFNTGDGIWFSGSTGETNVDKDDPDISRQSTYSIPNNAKQVRFKVKPISETYEKNDVETSHWEAEWSDIETWTDDTPLATPGTPGVEVDKFNLTATLDNIEITNATHIEFQVVKDNSPNPFASYKAEIVTAHASHVFTIEAGSQYKVRCRAYNSADTSYSDWSAYSANQGTIPSAPGGITELKALSESSVHIAWTEVPNATGYGIEYTTKKIYFDSSNEVQSFSVSTAITHAELTGLTPGEEYFFRVRAVNDDGESGWCEIQSLVIGEKPAAPTTWSSTTTAITGKEVILYWVHNTGDGSSQTYAELQLYIGDQLEEHTIKNSEDEDEKDRTSQYVLDTSSFVEGTAVKWRVRTAGITKEYGEWSIQRSIDIYAPATLQLNVTDLNGNDIDTLTSFPFYIKGVAGPNTQAPIGYHVSVKSNEIYETNDSIGNPRTINKDEELYSKYFDTEQALLLEMSAGSIDLANNINYTVTCVVSMNSGLTAEATKTFNVQWTDQSYIPNAEIGLDRETMTASIRPYCSRSRRVIYQVTDDSETYTKTDTELSSVWGEPVKQTLTTTGEQVYYGMTADGDELHYCKVEETTPVTDILLSVYRREFDGTFTELATGLDGSRHTTVTDPHPALDFARYRIVATTTATGAVGYYDPPGYPVGGKEIILQWDEAWSNFETDEAAAIEQPVWSGSMLKLPYNISVSESNNSDAALIEYAGRTHPVSYYGTQLGISATWSMDIPKTDKETIYALRRLARWMGDVYVREPSGSGYWARVLVSFNQTSGNPIIPVSLNISQVEGGI